MSWHFPFMTCIRERYRKGVRKGVTYNLMFFQGLEKQGWVLPKVGTVRNNFSPPAIARETAEGSEEERWIANE